MVREGSGGLKRGLGGFERGRREVQEGSREVRAFHIIPHTPGPVKYTYSWQISESATGAHCLCT